MTDDMQKIEEMLTAYPLYQYAFTDTADLLFTERVREICRNECPRYGTSWSCPPAVGSVESCSKRCMAYPKALFFSTVTEVEEILDMDQTLATRGEHERITGQIEEELKSLGYEVYTLSSESCAICEHCAYPEGCPCRHPEKMHPCIESHGIVVSDLVERCEMDYYLGERLLLWFSIVFLRGRML